MIGIELNDSGKVFPLHENWNEIIDAGLYNDVIAVLHKAEPLDINKMNMLQVLCPDFNGFTIGKMLGAGSKAERQKLSDFFNDGLASQIIDAVFPILNFMYDGHEFYKNPYPMLKHNGVVYKSPMERLVNQSGWQWEISHHAQVRYIETQDMNALADLVAANFVPEGEQFSEEVMDQTKSAFATLSPVVMLGFYLWYCHADHWWAKQFPWLFPSDDDDEEQSVKQRKPADPMAVRDIIFALADGKADKSWDEVKARSRQDLIYIMDKLEDKRLEAEAAVKNS
jgi:hypothetical protein